MAGAKDNDQQDDQTEEMHEANQVEVV